MGKRHKEDIKEYLGNCSIIAGLPGIVDTDGVIELTDSNIGSAQQAFYKVETTIQLH